MINRIGEKIKSWQNLKKIRARVPRHLFLMKKEIKLNEKIVIQKCGSVEN